MITEELAAKVRGGLAGAGDIREVRMFGGIGFMVNGNMAAAVSRRGLLVRVGKDGQSRALSQPGARAMEMRGRVIEGYVYVDPEALTEEAVRMWLRHALEFVQSLPPRQAGPKPARARERRK